MITSKVTQKGQATIPVEIRNLLSLKPGDNIAFYTNDGKVSLKKVSSFDIQYAEAIELSLASEWKSDADNEAYNDL